MKAIDSFRKIIFRKPKIVFIMLCILLSFGSTSESFAQVYLLNEDFSSASVTNPPPGWSNIKVVGQPTDLWHFDNPGTQTLNFPVSGQFAIFDAANYSSGGGAEQVVLETPFFDASVSNYIYLYFNHYMMSAPGCQGVVKVFNGTSWVTLNSFTSTNHNPDSVKIDLSGFVGGITNAKIRFEWQGNGGGFWAIDNVRILAPLYLDAGITSLDYPQMPFNSGNLPVKVSLTNFGYANLTSTTIHWSVNGIVQPQVIWNGNIPNGSTVNNILLGNFNFNSGIIKTIRIWQTNPNNSFDQNPQNDTTITKIVSCLCGQYTIGGSNPDYISFSESAWALNNAGITCPVTFKVRNGTYDEHFLLNEVSGSSSFNPIVYESESGDSSLVNLTYTATDPNNDFTILLNGTDYITLRKLSIGRSGGSYGLIIRNQSHHVAVNNNCLNSLVFKPNSSLDSCLTFNENVVNVRIEINQPSNLTETNITLKRNKLMTGNVIGIYNNNKVYFENNSLFYNSWWINAVYFESNVNTSIKNNVFESNPGTYGCSHLYCVNETNLLIESNNFLVNSVHSWAGMNALVVVNGANLAIRKNYAIYNMNMNPGNGFYVGGTADNVIIDSNKIVNFSNGIYCAPPISNVTIHNNDLLSQHGSGIYAEGTSFNINHNKVLKFAYGNGIDLRAASSSISNNFLEGHGLGVTNGIQVSSTSANANIIFNTVRLSPVDPDNTAALDMSLDNSATVKNNVFANFSKANAVKITTTGAAVLTMDKNDYYSYGSSFFLFNNQKINRLSDWQTITGQDPNSFDVDPFFTNDSLPKPNQVLLNNMAAVQAGITDDIDFDARAANPDIGCKEFNVCVVDAGINEITEPVNPLSAGSQNVKVKLQNQGTANLTSVTVNWSVNGTIQSPLNWSGNLGYKANMEVIVGNFNFLSGTTYNIVAWTSNPNGLADCNHDNDTTFSKDLAAALCGVYTIGGFNPNFQTFTDAVTALNVAGQTCPVIFKVRSGTYVEHFIIKEVPGNSSVNTITFESENNDSTAAVLNYSIDNPTSNYNIIIDGTDYLTFRKLKIQRSVGGRNIVIQGNAHHLQFLNNYLGHVYKGNTSYDSVMVFRKNYMETCEFNFTQPDTNSIGNIILDSNIISGQNNAININNTEKIIFTHNKNYGRNNAIIINGCKKADIIDNEFYSPNWSDYNAVNVGNSNDINVLRNRIDLTSNVYYSSVGVSVSGCNHINLRSNTIKSINGPVNVYGINVGGLVNNIDIVSNDIRNFYYGINMDVTGYNHQVRYNTVYNGTKFGISLKGSDFHLVANKISGLNTGFGIIAKISNSIISNNYIQISGADPTGIYTNDLTDNVKILHNSVNITGVLGNQSQNLNLSAGNNLEVRNNIFINAADGFPVMIGNSVTNSILDYNDYYSSSGKIGFFQNAFSDLNAWKIAIGGDTHSLNYPAFFQSDTNLVPSQSALNNVAQYIPAVPRDVDSTVRNPATPDIGAKEFTICTLDAGIDKVSAPVSPVNMGNQVIKVKLHNHGTSVINSVQIKFSVNDVIQPAFNFVGALPVGAIQEVAIGNFNFGANQYKIKAWTSSPNNNNDCNHYNDTIVNTVRVRLCGMYTIGGTNPDFQNFSEVAEALNNVGISCAVLFKVRNGTYDEHFTLDSIIGNSVINTVTFESESGDSSLARLYYTSINPDYNYLMKINGPDYLTFRKLTLIRNNQEPGIFIQKNSHHINFSNCRLGNIFSPPTSYDTVITIHNNYFDGCYVDISQPTHLFRSRIDVSDNVFVGGFNGRSFVINLSNNRDIKLHGNNINIGAWNPFQTINLSGNVKVVVDSNLANSCNAWGNSYCLFSANDTNVNIINNHFYINPISWGLSAAIRIYNVDSTRISKNIISGGSGNSNGIFTDGTLTFLEISNNEIYNVGTGINNNINTPNCKIHHNIIHDISNGNGIYLSGSNSKIFSNKIYDINEGNGLVISGNNFDIFNNFIHAKGIGLAKGIVVNSSTSNNRILFNSLNITSIDMVNGRSLEIKSCDNLIVKNNIFSNSGGGFPVYVDCSPAGSTWDFNDFFSSSGMVGYLNGTLYNGFGPWTSAINGDANSKYLNPYYASPINLRPYQRMINGAGVPIAGITLDIDDQLRNNIAPDIGADEFRVDFGITQLLNPQNYCTMVNNDSIVINLRQFGDIPYKDLKLAYSVNNGPIYTDTIPGYLYNDTIYAFKHHFNFAAMGTYSIKCWLIQTYDDNVVNDTLITHRFSYPAPSMNFTPAHACIGQPVQFTSLVTIPAPFSIASQHWKFNNGDSSAVFNPVHVFNIPGPAAVKLQAFSNMGCFNDTTILVNVTGTPLPGFSTVAVCLGDTSYFQNHSSVNPTESLTYRWKFGNGDSSATASPGYLYSLPGNYNVTLVAASASGCYDSLQQTVTVNRLPVIQGSHHDVNCYGENNGWATINASGSVAPYSYLWSNNTTYDTAFNLVPGNYSLVVTDSLGCQKDTAFLIQQPDSVFVIVKSCNSVCSGAFNGWASLAISGGTKPYTFLWNTGAISDSVYGLSPGNYSVTVTDSNSCTKTVTFSILSLNHPLVTANGVDVACYGDHNGQATASVSGGIPGYSYLWSTTPVAQNTPTATNLAAGTYNVIVTDTLGCTDTAEVQIQQPQSFTLASSVITPVSCFGKSDGQISVSVSGATSPYQYLWSTIPAQTTASISNLTQGTYIITISDNNACDTVFSFTIIEPALLNAVYLKQDEGCSGSCSGSVLLSATGGTPPFSFTWNTSPVQNDSIATGLCPGFYWATITDSHGCVKISDTASVITNSPMLARFTASDSTGFAPKTIVFQYTGYGAGSFLWDFGNSNTSALSSPEFTFETGGEYKVMMLINSENPDFCTDTAFLTIRLENPSRIKIPNAFSPNNDGYNDVFRIESESLGVLDVIITNRWGEKVAEISTIDGCWDGKINGKPAADGVYYYNLTAKGKDDVGFSRQGTITLVR